MAKNDTLFDSEEGKQRIARGISRVAAAIGKTMGTRGANALIETPARPGYYVSNDGFSIAASIVFADPLEDLGRKVLLSGIRQANQESNDGSSTTAVLTDAILKEGQKAVEGGESAVLLAKSLEACIPVLEKAIKERAEAVTPEDIDTIQAVATVSSEDEGIGRRIAEIYKAIGKDGIVYCDNSKTSEDSYSIGSSISMEGAKAASPYLCDYTSDGTITDSISWAKPAILLVREKVVNSIDFSELVQAMYAQGVRQCIMFCEEIDPLVVADFVKLRMMQQFTMCPVIMPVIWRDEWWEDLSYAMDANILDSAVGKPPFKANVHDCGNALTISLRKGGLRFESSKSMATRIAELKQEDTEASNVRAARLNVKTAKYFVGATSETALGPRQLKVEDAIGAAQKAIDQGIVPGGGVTLWNAAKALPENIAGAILGKALGAPLRQIIANSGEDSDAVMKRIADKKDTEHGFNSSSKKVENLRKAMIIDPAGVVIGAMKAAVSTASYLLTAPTIITLPEKEPDQVMGRNGRSLVL